MDKRIKEAFERHVRERDMWSAPSFRLSETGAMYEGLWLQHEYNRFAAGFNAARPAHDAMLAALLNVQKLIAEAAMVRFDWGDGDWAERLFLSQQATSDAIAKVGGDTEGTKLGDCPGCGADLRMATHAFGCDRAGSVHCT